LLEFGFLNFTLISFSGLVLDTALWNALPSDVDGSLDKSDPPDSTFFGSIRDIRDKDPILVQLQPVGYEVVAESEALFWNSQGLLVVQDNSRLLFV
jgi:hypothetical protein